MVSLLWQFIYFSFTSQTTTGFGDIVPIGALPRLIVSVQLLMTVVFTFVILGLGLSHLTADSRAAQREEDVQAAMREARARSERVQRLH